MTTKRRTLTITHPDNTTSTRSTTADYLYGVECGPVETARWEWNLQSLIANAETYLTNIETLLTDGFATSIRPRWHGEDGGTYANHVMKVVTLDRSWPVIGEEVSTWCNAAGESLEFMRDAEGEILRDADGTAREIVRNGAHVLRDALERLHERKTDYVESLRQKLAEGPTANELTYSVIRWSKSHELAAKACDSKEFAHLRQNGHTLTVVKVDQAHEGYEPGVYVSPGARQSARRQAAIAAADAELAAAPVAPEQDTPAAPAAPVVDKAQAAADELLADLAERFPVGTDVIVGSGERFTVRGHTAHRSEPGRIVTDRGEWLAEECSRVRPVVNIDMYMRNSAIVLVTGTGAPQSPQAHVTISDGLWVLDSEYTDNDAGVEPVKLSASTLPYVVRAFVEHLGFDPVEVDVKTHDIDGADDDFLTAEAPPVPVSPTLLDTAVMTWNADRSLVSSRWQFYADKAFASRMRDGQWVAVIEVNDDRDAFKLAVVDVLTARKVRSARFYATIADVESKMVRVLDVADEMLRQVAGA